MKFQNGFTFVEIVIIMGITVILSMIATVNFFPVKQKVSLSTTIQSLVTDIKQQQSKSMGGESTQGIYFDPSQNNYTIFKGSTYLTNDPSNFTISLGDRISVSSIDFSNRQIIFAALSGEISNFQPGNKISLKNNDSGEERTLNFNQYGTIISVQ